MEKPPKLYHASARKDLGIIEPRAHKSRDSREGPKVFATSDKRLSSIFITGMDDSWCRKGMFGNIPYVVISDYHRFKDLDNGGSIYHLPSESFESDPNKGLGILEWVSSDPIIPTHKEDHNSSLGAMIDQGVQVYFVDENIFNQICSSQDHGLTILQGLISENQKIGKHCMPL